MTNLFARIASKKETTIAPSGDNKRDNTLNTVSLLSKGSFKKWFFLFTLLVAICYLTLFNVSSASPFTTAIYSVFIMIPYCVFAWVRANATGQYDDFGDSCYFMGFLLTLVSLVISLIAFDTDTDNSSLIIGRFGAAISTTLAGMLARVLIVQFHDTEVSAPEQAEAQIAITMGKLARELDESLGHFKNLRSTAVNNINQATKAAETRINNAVESQLEVTEKFTIEAFERHGKLLDNLEKNLGNVAIDTGPLKESLEKSMGVIELQMGRLGDVLSGLGDAGAASEKQWMGLHDQLKTITHALEQLKSGSEGLQDTGEKLRIAGERIHKATDILGSSDNIVAKLVTTLETSNDTIDSMKSGIESNLQDIQTLRDLIGEEHAAAAKTTEEVYNRLAKALELAAIKLEKAR